MIPGEGTVSDYIKNVLPERKSATFLRCNLWGPEETYDPYDSVIDRMQEKADRKNDKNILWNTTAEMGIAHENRDGKRTTIW